MKWKELVFTHVQVAKLSGSVLRLMQREREWEPNVKDDINIIVQSFVTLGFEIDKNGEKKDSCQIYDERLETPLLETIGKDYVGESAALWGQTNFCDYLARVEKRLQEEEGRLSSMLPKTRALLIDRLGRVKRDALTRQDLESVSPVFCIYYFAMTD